MDKKRNEYKKQCKSIFKSGEDIKARYTEKWIRIINNLEKDKKA